MCCPLLGEETNIRAMIRCVVGLFCWECKTNIIPQNKACNVYYWLTLLAEQTNITARIRFVKCAVGLLC